MNSQVSEELAKLVAHKDALHKKREQVVNSIRANQNSFDDDVVLCRVVVELTEEIKRLDLIFAQRMALNDCGLLDDLSVGK